MTFDPYHQWLGIPPREQPPNHYRLLGIDLFESNGDVIAYAADRQMTHLRTFQSSRYVAESQRLLNEVAAARVCLLDPTRRLAYDAELRARLGGVPPTDAVETPPVLPPAAMPPAAMPPAAMPPAAMPPDSSPPVSSSPSVSAAPSVSANRPRVVAQPGAVGAASGSSSSGTSSQPLVTTSPSRKKRQRSMGGELVKIVAGGLFGCVMALTVLYFGFHLDPLDLSGTFGLPSPEAPANQSATVASLATPDKAGNSAAGASSENSAPKVDSVTAPSAASVQRPSATDPPKNSQASAGKSTSEPAGGVGSMSTPLAPRRPRVAIPPADEQAKSKTLLQELYKLDVTRSRGEKFELIEKLLKAADEETASDVERFVLLRHSADIAADNGDAASVRNTLLRLAASFEFDVAVAVERLLARTAENVRTEAGMDEFIPISQDAVIDLIGANRVDLAMKLTDATYAACLKPQGKSHRKFVFDGQTALKRLHALWLASEDARLAIEAGESTGERRWVYGRFLGCQLGEWEIAIPLLAECDEVEVRLAAQRDLTRPTDVEGRVAVGDMWYELSQRMANDAPFADRAQYWYQLASGSATGLVKTKVATRLEECRERLSGYDQREMSAAGLRRKSVTQQ